jgi:molybdate transport system substrate-binding protein
MWWALKRFSFLAIFLLACSGPKKPKIYLASSLAKVANDLKEFDVVLMSSSAIAKHIKEGAPCDAVLLADEKWWKYLNDKNLILEKNNLAKNRLVLASNRPQKKLPIKEALQLIGDRALIVAEDHVPLGAYAVEALKALGLFEKLERQLVRANSASHAAMLLKNSRAEFAILYESDLGANFLVSNIDEELHHAILYPFSFCKNVDSKKQRLIKEVIFSQGMKEILQKSGLGAL